MDKINWYFEQPVTFDEMRFSDNAKDVIVQQLLSEGEHPWGIVNGWNVIPGTGLQIRVSGFSFGACWDRQGRRILPSIDPILQSIATATDGASTAVVSSGNERWVSVFARAGRVFSDTSTDGNGVSLRKTALRVLNELGDAEHPAGAYEPIAAKEAGVNRFYLVVGLEDAFGRAVRPSLIQDGVLIADIHIRHGMTTLDTLNIVTDRRQLLIPAWVSGQATDRDLYLGRSGVSKYGPTSETTITGSSSDYTISVAGGGGYVFKSAGGAQGRQYRRYQLDNSTRVIPVAPPHATLNRQDLLVIDHNNEVKVIEGTPATEALPPSVPNQTVALAEIRATPGSANTGAWPYVRKSFRRLPYPYSTQTGVIEGCRLEWSSNGTCWLRSVNNKIAFDGDVVEFTGGLASLGFPINFTQQDANANPFGTAAGSNHRPYFIYACRNEFWTNGSHTSPVILLESTVPPDDNTGRPQADLRGPRRFIPPADSVVIGVGWVQAGSSSRAMVQVGPGGWYHPFGAGGYAAPAPGSLGPLQFPGSPPSQLLRAIRFQVSGIPLPTTYNSLNIYSYHNATALIRSIDQPPLLAVVPGTPPNPTAYWDYNGTWVGASPGAQSLGEYVVPVVLAGWVRVGAGGTFYLSPQAYQFEVPHVSFGGG